MFAAIIMIAIIWGCMWGFYKFMYPRAPKSMMPKKGDVTTPRQCDFCGHTLAEYRGVLETKAEANPADIAGATTGESLFFCNHEHQADFHAGKRYQ